MRRFLLPFCLFCLLAHSGPAQDVFLDSLQQLLNRQGGDQRLSTLLTLAFHSYEYDKNKAYQFATDALSLARSAGNLAAEKHALSLQGEYFYNIHDFTKARSLFRQSQAISTPNARAEAGYNDVLWGNSYKMTSQTDSARLFLNRAIRELERCDRPDFRHYAYISMSTLLLDRYELASSRQILDKAALFAQAQNDPAMQAEVLIEMARLENIADNYFKAKELLENASQLLPGPEIGYTKAKLLYQQAYVEYNLGFFNRSFALLYELLKSGNIEQCAYLQTRIYHLLGMVYVEKGEYEQALTYYLNAVKVLEQAGMRLELGRIYNDMAWLYFKRYNDAETVVFLQRSNELSYKLDDAYGQAKNHSILGSMYAEQEKYAESIQEHTRAMEGWQRLQARAHLASSFYNLGTTYEKMGNLDSALIFATRCLDIDKSLGSAMDLGGTNKKIALLYMKQKKYAQAKICLDTARSYATQTNALELRRDVELLYSKWYEQQGNLNKALQVMRYAYQLSDSIHQASNAEKMAEMRAVFDLDNMELKNKEQEQKIAMEHIEVENQKNRIFLIVVILILMSILFVVGAVFYALSRRQNKLLHQEIAERKHLESDLQISRERWKVAVDGSNDGLWDWDIAAGTVYYSPRWEEMLGYASNEATQTLEAFTTLVHPDDLTGMFEKVNQYLRGETPHYAHEFRMFHRNGTPMWTLHRAAAIYDEHGTPVRMIGTTADITERKNAEEQILKSQRNFEEAQALAHVGSWEVNLSTGKFEWSKEIYRIFELENLPEETLSEAWRRKCHPDDLPKLETAIMRAAEKGEQFSIEIRLICNDGSTKYVNSMGAPQRDNDGNIIGLRGTDQDVTLQKQAAMAKSEFLSIMSHEIRTPINGVIGISNLLMQENLNPVQKEYVSTLNFSAHHLSNVVSDILDFSKIESGNINIEKLPFDLQKVTDSIVKLFEHKAREKNIAYHYLPDPAINYFISGDYVRLSQILSNLLSNAIKFTEKGSVEFKYNLTQENAHSVKIAFAVKDTGIGIDERQQAKIFEIFSQADASIARRYGGTGLGLAISKRLTELLGGTISVESSPGRGSVFTVEIVFDKCKTDELMRLKMSGSEPVLKELTGMKILVAEDNNINILVLTRFLKKWKAEFTVAKDGHEAIGQLRSHAYDVILMDVQMPNLDGREATKIIRDSTQENIRDIPIIAFTAEASIDSHRELMNNGFDDCITKPFHPDALFSLLKHYYKPGGHSQGKFDLDSRNPIT